jgi:hypothetical protein
MGAKPLKQICLGAGSNFHQHPNLLDNSLNTYHEQLKQACGANVGKLSDPQHSNPALALLQQQLHTLHQMKQITHLKQGGSAHTMHETKSGGYGVQKNGGEPGGRELSGESGESGEATLQLNTIQHAMDMQLARASMMQRQIMELEQTQQAHLHIRDFLQRNAGSMQAGSMQPGAVGPSGSIPQMPSLSDVRPAAAPTTPAAPVGSAAHVHHVLSSAQAQHVSTSQAGGTPCATISGGAPALHAAHPTGNCNKIHTTESPPTLAGSNISRQQSPELGAGSAGSAGTHSAGAGLKANSDEFSGPPARDPIGSMFQTRQLKHATEYIATIATGQSAAVVHNYTGLGLPETEAEKVYHHSPSHSPPLLPVGIPTGQGDPLHAKSAYLYATPYAKQEEAKGSRSSAEMEAVLSLCGLG